MDNKQTNMKRRGFLLAAGVGTAGAVAVVATGAGGKEAAQTAVAEAPGKPQEKTGGYAETRHVSNYYRTARV